MDAHQPDPRAGLSELLPGMTLRRADVQLAALIFVIFAPDRSPSTPFSPQTKPLMGSPTMALSYCSNIHGTFVAVECQQIALLKRRLTNLDCASNVVDTQLLAADQADLPQLAGHDRCVRCTRATLRE